MIKIGDKNKGKYMRQIFMAAVIALPLFAGILYLYFSRFSFTYLFPENSVDLYPSKRNAYSVYGASLDDEGLLTVTSNDPQVLFAFHEPKKIGSVKIQLDLPAAQDSLVELYYAAPGKNLSEANVVRDYIGEGKKEQIFFFFGDEYSILRVDINANVDLSTIQYSTNKLQKVYNHVSVFSIILLYVGLFAFCAYWLTAENKHIMHEISRYFDLPWLSAREKGYLCFCFCFYLVWAMTFMSWGYGPDEYMRYDVPKFIFENKALPFGNEESIRSPIYGFSYGFDLMLPYIISAFFMNIVSLFTTQANLLLLSARLTSILSMLGVAYFAILISKKTLGNDPIRWLFVFLMSLLPQIVFLASYVNLDSFSLFTVMMIIYGWIYALEKKWSRSSLVFLSIGLGLCFISYRFVYSYILLTLVLYIVWHLLNREETSFKSFIIKGLLILAITFSICGWVFIRNAILYNGDFLARHASEPYAELYAIDAYKPSLKISIADTGLSMWDMLREYPWIESTYKSLIGTFGYMSIHLYSFVYSFYSLLFIAGGIGTLIRGICAVTISSKGRFSQKTILIGLATALASIITIMISIFFSWSYDYQAQGRYIISITPALFMIVTIGMKQWRTILQIVLKAEQKRHLMHSILILMLGFIVLSAVIGYYCCLKEFVYPFQ